MQAIEIREFTGRDFCIGDSFDMKRCCLVASETDVGEWTQAKLALLAFHPFRADRIGDDRFCFTVFLMA
ncbi:MAG: hypothetical protein K9J74_06065 [Sulfuritalea sp.]|nr:hypothetical protein [Sulfuritalea sp.]